MNVLVVDRHLAFADLAARLRAEGWQQADDPTAPTPLIEGEPEIAAFERADSGHAEARLHYHFDPATGLRQLRASGPRGDAELEALAPRLLGLGSEQAQAALEALRTIGHWKEENPDKSSIFLLSGSSHNKLQILRWIGHGRRESNEHIEAVLRTAFDDVDWEVRVTALTIAARLRATALRRDVAGTRLPEDTADGVNLDERRMLRTIQLCAIELLEGAGMPPASDAAPTTRAAMHDHLLRCIAGEPVHHHEKAFLYITSLATPLPDEVPAPVLPAGISRTDDGFLLDALGLALCWIPPVEHWLGEELPRMRVANPIRLAQRAGFFVARDLFAGSEGAAALQCDHATALGHCLQLGEASGLAIRLPSADEWEMAARGPDARRFPWGNNARSAARLGESPWGVRDAVGQHAQWTATDDAEGVLVCGAANQWVCAMRTPADRRSLQAFRFIVSL